MRSSSQGIADLLIKIDYIVLRIAFFLVCIFQLIFASHPTAVRADETYKTIEEELRALYKGLDIAPEYLDIEYSYVVIKTVRARQNENHIEISVVIDPRGLNDFNNSIISDGVSRAFLLFSFSADEKWQRAEMTNTSGTIWKTAIPLDAARPFTGEFTWFVVALDRMDNINSEMPPAIRPEYAIGNIDTSIWNLSNSSKKQYYDELFWNEYGVASKYGPEITFFADWKKAAYPQTLDGLQIHMPEISRPMFGSGFKALADRDIICSPNSGKTSAHIDISTTLIDIGNRSKYFRWDKHNPNVKVAVWCENSMIFFQFDRSDFFPPFPSRRMTASFIRVPKGLDRQDAIFHTKFINLDFQYHTCKISGGRLIACYRKHDS